MNKSKLEKLKAMGWQVGSDQEFLRLSDEEAELFEAKLAQADCPELKRRTKSRIPAKLAHRSE
jgi:hypothetical protein